MAGKLRYAADAVAGVGTPADGSAMSRRAIVERRRRLHQHSGRDESCGRGQQFLRCLFRLASLANRRVLDNQSPRTSQSSSRSDRSWEPWRIRQASRASARRSCCSLESAVARRTCFNRRRPTLRAAFSSNSRNTSSSGGRKALESSLRTLRAASGETREFRSVPDRRPRKSVLVCGTSRTTRAGWSTRGKAHREGSNRAHGLARGRRTEHGILPLLT